MNKNPNDYTEISSDELLHQFRNGGTDSVISEILERFEEPLADFVRKTVPKYLRRNIGGTIDLTQSVLLDFLQNREQITSNSEYVQRHFAQDDSQLWRLLVSIVARHHQKHKKRIQRKPQNFGALSIDANEIEPVSKQSLATEDVIEDVCSDMSENEKIVFIHYWVPKAAGVKKPPTQSQIAKDHGLSRRSVERIVNELKTKISNYIDE